MAEPSPSVDAPEADAPTPFFYATTARTLAGCARRMGLKPPTFASPPCSPHNRTISRRGSKGCIVSVRLRGRTRSDVAGDMVEGIIAANNLTGDHAAAARSELTAACGPIPSL